jgi:hypothetical protein
MVKLNRYYCRQSQCEKVGTAWQMTGPEHWKLTGINLAAHRKMRHAAKSPRPQIAGGSTENVRAVAKRTNRWERESGEREEERVPDSRSFPRAAEAVSRSGAGQRESDFAARGKERETKTNQPEEPPPKPLTDEERRQALAGWRERIRGER